VITATVVAGVLCVFALVVTIAWYTTLMHTPAHGPPIPAREETAPRNRVVICGARGAGKTCLVTRLCTDRFDPRIWPSPRRTAHVKVGDARLPLEIDEAREPIDLLLDSTGACTGRLFVIVFDVTDRGSFMALDAWRDLVKHGGAGGSAVIVAASKCDLPHAVSAAECNAWGAARGVRVVMTSAMTGDNVQALWADVAARTLP